MKKSPNKNTFEKIQETNINIETIGFLLQNLDLTEYDENKLAELSIYFNQVGNIIRKFSSEIFQTVEEDS